MPLLLLSVLRVHLCHCALVVAVSIATKSGT